MCRVVTSCFSPGGSVNQKRDKFSALYRIETYPTPYRVFYPSTRELGRSLAVHGDLDTDTEVTGDHAGQTYSQGEADDKLSPTERLVIGRTSPDWSADMPVGYAQSSYETLLNYTFYILFLKPTLNRVQGSGRKLLGKQKSESSFWSRACNVKKVSVIFKSCAVLFAQRVLFGDIFEHFPKIVFVPTSTNYDQNIFELSTFYTMFRLEWRMPLKVVGNGYNLLIWNIMKFPYLHQ